MDRLRRPARSDLFGWTSFVLDADDLLLMCRSAARTDNAAFVFSGRCGGSGPGESATPLQPRPDPNGNIPDCIGGGARTAIGMATARSRHPGGVNVLMGDGSLRFIMETIAKDVWPGFGTRNGSELVD